MGFYGAERLTASTVYGFARLPIHPSTLQMFTHIDAGKGDVPPKRPQWNSPPDESKECDKSNARLSGPIERKHKSERKPCHCGAERQAMTT